MRLIYIANMRLPTEKAHGLAVMKMCEAFAKQGVEVELVIPRRLNEIKEDPFEYYGVEDNFKITRLPCVDLMRWLGKVGFYLQALTFAESAFWYGLVSRADIIYGRDELALSHLCLFKKNVVWESHTAKSKWLVSGLLKRSKVLVVISRGLRDYYLSLGVPEKKILVAPSGVDLSKFEIKNSKSEIREMLGLPLDKKLIVYTGHLYGWKGVGTIVEASEMADENTLFVFVGGTEDDVAKMAEDNKLNKKLLFLGHKPHREIPLYLKSADVLVLSNTAKDELSERYTSPMKLVEYLTSGKPVVAPDLPSIRELAEGGDVNLFEPDNAKSLTQVLDEVLVKNNSSIKRDLKKFSWDNKAKATLSFIG